jgi:hypothetical protein
MKPNIFEFDRAEKTFRSGDALTDVQLKMLLVQYRQAANSLRHINHPGYALVVNDIRTNLERLEATQKYRRRNRD